MLANHYHDLYDEIEPKQKNLFQWNQVKSSQKNWAQLPNFHQRDKSYKTFFLSRVFRWLRRCVFQWQTFSAWSNIWGGVRCPLGLITISTESRSRHRLFHMQTLHCITQKWLVNRIKFYRIRPSREVEICKSWWTNKNYQIGFGFNVDCNNKQDGVVVMEKFSTLS